MSFKNKIVIYDNEGETYDRITVVLKNRFRYKDGKRIYEALGCSESGFGFFQHTEAMRGGHLGKIISFKELSEELQERLTDYFNS